ncbi:hypothetical protein [Labilibacter marinus]|uniref:hypothetical protein n=1 Tax=Labilibacter marinus TaxID=1477105 RepID=UPI001179ACAB|nr:hypothetical protein [Labilibacter marinus]
MRKWLVLFLALGLFFGCKKEQEMNVSKKIQDVNRNIKIGSDAQACYEVLELMYENGNILKEMHVDNLGSESYKDVATKVLLYSSFMITDDREGRVDSVWYSFEGDLLKYITLLNTISPLTGAPTPLEKWPEYLDGSGVVELGETKIQVLNKINELASGSLDKNIPVFLNGKNLAEDYDDNLESSFSWRVIESGSSRIRSTNYILDITFNNDVVSSKEIKQEKVVGYN